MYTDCLSEYSQESIYYTWLFKGAKKETNVNILQMNYLN